MPTEISKAKVKWLSLVEKGANNKKPFFVKSDDSWVMNGRILKADESTKHIMRIVAYEPNTVDLQNDWMSEETIEDIAHDFMKNYRNIDMEHNFKAGYGDLLESYVAMCDMEINGQIIMKGSWVVGIGIDDEMYQKVENGEIGGVSIAGTGKRIEAEPMQKSMKEQLKELWNEINIFKAKANVENKDKNNNDNEEILVNEELKKFLKETMNEFKTDIMKSVKEENEASREAIAKSVKEDVESVKELVIEKTKVEKSADEKKAEQIAELKKTIEEQGLTLEDITKSMEKPATAETTIEKAATTKKINIYSGE